MSGEIDHGSGPEEKKSRGFLSSLFGSKESEETPPYDLSPNDSFEPSGSEVRTRDATRQIVIQRCVQLLREGNIEDFNKIRPHGKLDLSREDLSGLNLAGADLRHVNLSRASLRGSDLTGARLQHANLDFADLSETKLTQTKFFKATLKHTLLERVREASEAEFQEANLRSADLTLGNFDGAYFEQASLISATLTKAKFRGAQMSHARMMAAIMIETDFEGANMHRARMFQANGRDTNFAEANLTEAEAINAHFKYGEDDADKFSGTWIRGFKQDGAIDHVLLRQARRDEMPPEGYFRTAPSPEDEKILVNGIPGSDKVAYDAAMEELSELIGLTEVKTKIKKLMNHLQHSEIRKSLGEPELEYTLHAVYTGSPGTGKTTVARLVSRLFNALGALPGEGIVEVDRGGLIANYAGQTAGKTNAAVDRALGRSLVIDEAYALAESDNDAYAKEAIATLVKRLEDDRSKFAAIACGYKEPMERFINANPGLKDRFSHFIDFPDYNTGELVDIMRLFLDKKHYEQSPDLLANASILLAAAKVKGADNFANGRTVRKTFEKMTWQMSDRFVESGALETRDRTELMTPLASDLPYDEIVDIPQEALPKPEDLTWKLPDAPSGAVLSMHELANQESFPCLTRESYDKITAAVEAYERRQREQPVEHDYV